MLHPELVARLESRDQPGCFHVQSLGKGGDVTSAEAHAVHFEVLLLQVGHLKSGSVFNRLAI